MKSDVSESRNSLNVERDKPKKIFVKKSALKIKSENSLEVKKSKMDRLKR